MEHIIREIVRTEADLLSKFIVEFDEKLRKKVRQQILELLKESYSLLSKQEKIARIQMLEALTLKVDKLAQDHNIKDKDSLLLEEFKSLLYKISRDSKDSYKAIKSPLYYKAVLCTNYLVPKDTRNRIQQTNDINETERYKSLLESLVKLIVSSQ